MKLSLIVPVYNGAAYLEENLRGWERPAFPYEILLVDDGSTDGTGEILDRLAGEDPCLRVFHRPNGGPAAARNFALGEARGEWIMFCDADDAYFPGALTQAVAEAEGRGLDLLLAGFAISEPGKEPTPYTVSTCDLGGAALGEALSGLYRANMLNQVWAKVFRRELLAGLQFPDRKWGEDRLFFFEALARAKKPGTWEKPIYQYRQQPGSLISRFLPEKPAVCREVDEAFRALAQALGARSEELEKTADYMFVKSLWSSLTTLYGPTCSLSHGEKRAFVRSVLAEEKGKERRYPPDCGRAFQVLAMVLKTGNVSVVSAAARAVSLGSRLLPGAARRAKHAYNR